MKLRNKKNGEMYELKVAVNGDLAITKDDEIINICSSLAELNAEWEDVDGPKECKYWYIDVDDDDVYQTEDKKWLNDRNRKLIGNYFATKEEAEKAVEKLKAWERLKDKGFKFEGWAIDDWLKISICTNFEGDNIYSESEKEIKADLDICFGGEE